MILSPFVQRLSFDKLIHSIELQAQSNNEALASAANFVLDKLQYRSALIEGIEDISDLSKYKKDINHLMNQLFPPSLLNNEIKMAVTPLDNNIIFKTDRFIKIFGESEDIDFKMIRGIDDDTLYIFYCSWILKAFYNVPISAGDSSFCSVQGPNDLTKYYRTLMNAEFFTMVPMDNAPTLTPDDIDELLSNGKDIELWKKHFPPGSYCLKGFGILNLYDSTRDQALSNFKDLLIVKEKFDTNTESKLELQNILRIYLQIPDLDIDVLLYDTHKDSLRRIDQGIACIGLAETGECNANDLFCNYTKNNLFVEHRNFLITDIKASLGQEDNIGVIKGLLKSGYKSYLAAPIKDGDKLIGILEFASRTPKMINSLTEYDIQKILPITEASLKAYVSGYSNELSAIVQNECTAIHPSVEWKFYEEADKFLHARHANEAAQYEEIAFKDLYALYGQIDVSGSSDARNTAIASDLSLQLSKITDILQAAQEKLDMPLLNSINFQCNILVEQINSDLAAGIEQEVIRFIKEEITPLFKELRIKSNSLGHMIDSYQEEIHESLGIIYQERKKYDESLEIIGSTMASSIDKKQKSAQNIYPHYFERFKTDGVEHNMFIGQSIAPSQSFHSLYLRNLHLWQLRSMCEMEIEHNQMKNDLPLPLEVASLIMVYSSPLSIRYRMDEKQFDIDGAYNARYEIIKKRIDKAYIKGTKERITVPGKMVIVFTQQSDLDEYKTHINYLIYEGLLKNDMEIVDVQDLQGVYGLRAIRVSVNFEDQIIVEKKLMTREKDSSKAVAQ